MESRIWTCARCKIEIEAAVSASPDLDLLCSGCTELVHTPRYGLPKFRKRLGLSQTQLAERLPVKVDTLQNWEIGRTRPPSYLYRALRDLEGELRGST